LRKIENVGHRLGGIVFWGGGDGNARRSANGGRRLTKRLWRFAGPSDVGGKYVDRYKIIIELCRRSSSGRNLYGRVREGICL